MATDNKERMQARLAKLENIERKSREKAAKIKREMAAMDRKEEAYYLCTLGRAIDNFVDRHPNFRPIFQRHLNEYIEPKNFDALAKSSWAIDRSEAPSEPEPTINSEDTYHQVETHESYHPE